jgi:murein DD-endopeptidase MepM/ murein hydrolase activator NlpD
MKEEPSIQNLAKLSIRRLIDSIEDGDLAKDESLPLDYDTSTIFGKIRLKINTYITKYKRNSKKKDTFFLFLVSLFSYIAMRVRVVFVLLGVISEVLSQNTDGIRKVFVKNLFWGRGGIFKFALQFLTLVVTVLFLVGYLYRSSSPVSGVRFNATVAQEYGVEQTTGTDLLVQRSSSVTLSPKDRSRTGFIRYTVKSGDTLSRIAKETDVSMDTIVWANPFLEGSVLRPGDVLSIPPYDGVVAKAKKGDTVYTLAKKYKINPQLIADKNYLEYPYEIRVGDQIILPGASPLVAPKPVSTPSKVVYSGVFKPKVTYTSGASSVSNASKFLSWPVSGGQGTISQCYRGIYHNGFDIYDADFPKLVAAAPGKVVFAGCQSGSCPQRGVGAWGGVGLAWTVAIDHGNGFSTIYGHLDDIYVGSGSTVSAGQVIGRMGRTGYATGTHLHMMLIRGSWDSWNDTNPVPYFKSSTYSSHIAGACY